MKKMKIFTLITVLAVTMFTNYGSIVSMASTHSTEIVADTGEPSIMLTAAISVCMLGGSVPNTKNPDMVAHYWCSCGFHTTDKRELMKHTVEGNSSGDALHSYNTTYRPAEEPKDTAVDCTPVRVCQCGAHFVITNDNDWKTAWHQHVRTEHRTGCRWADNDYTEAQMRNLWPEDFEESKDPVEETVDKDAEKEVTEQAEREAAERAAKEQAEKEAREQAEREAAERAAKEQAEKEAREQAEREAAERAAKEQAEKEAREQAEREAAERAAKEQAEKEAREQAEREAAERAAKEQAEKEARERAEREAAERAAYADAETATIVVYYEYDPETATTVVHYVYKE